MQVHYFHRASLLALFIAGLVPAPARALLTFDEGNDQFFVTGNIGVSYNSNITDSNSGQADTIYSAGVGFQLLRRAGIISVDLSGGLDFSHFDKNTGDDFSNPHLQGEFSAKDERTTADLTLSTLRQSAADIVTGIRAVSWDDAAGFNVKYRVTDRYSVSGTLGYALIDYVNTPGLTNLTSYNAGANLFYSINSARDFFVGYNFGYQQTSNGLSYDDHSFNFGIDGKILPKLNGTVSVGYEIQVPHGPANAGTSATGALTEAIALTWNYSQRLKITGSLSQNFSTTAIGESVNTLASSLDASYAANAKTTFEAGIGGGHTRFIGAAANGRRDTYFDWNAGVNYSINDHFKVAANYTHMENWSNLSSAAFIQNVINLILNIRF
jgi:hypothetical protein